MGRSTSVLVVVLELAAIALAALWYLLGRVLPAWQHASLVLAVIALGGAVLLTFTGAPGLMRRAHDTFFDNSCGTTLRYIFLMRYNLLIALALLFFPPISVMTLRRLLDTFFHVRPWDMFFITWMSLLAAWTLMVGVQLTCRFGPQRFGGPPLVIRSAWISALRPVKVWIFALLAIPMVSVCLYYSDRRLAGIACALLGAICGWLTLVVVTWQRESLVSNSRPPSTLLIDGSRFRRDGDDEFVDDEGDIGIVLPSILRLLGPGYYDAERDRSQPGHLLAATLLGAVLCIYGLVGFAFRPAGGWNDWFPPLGYVLTLFLLAAWALPAAAFFFDRWRVPVLSSVLALCVLFYELAHTDHYFITSPIAVSSAAALTQASISSPSEAAAEPTIKPRYAPALPPVSLTPQEAMSAWMRARRSRADRMTVVTASGGGIAAAAWTAEVLCGLEEAFGESFVRSLNAISSASGGSVGAMHYLDGFNYKQARSANELQRIREAASRSSLPALTWGVAYPDLWRFVAPPLLQGAPYLDRGWALQEAWREQLLFPQESLQGWRAKIARGQMPVALFDATAVETGRQFLLTPVDVHRAGGPRFQAYHSFMQLYPDRDMDVVTAARLSATFPWVSPITRADRDSGGPSLHIADGAYFDNYGVATMIEWLNSVLPTYTDEQVYPKVLLIRISIRETSFTRELEYEQQDGWAYTLYGPLLTVLRVGSASQIARNEQLLELLADRWTAQGQLELTVVNFWLTTEVPLNWQLTEAARNKIRARWAEEVSANKRLKTVRDFFRR